MLNSRLIEYMLSYTGNNIKRSNCLTAPLLRSKSSQLLLES